jgi:transcription antitermination factor NusG
MSLDGITGDWFAVQVRAGREALAARHLRTRGYEVFLPTYRERRRWSDRVKIVEQALFAGYVFSRFQIGVVGKVITTPEVIRIVGSGISPQAVPSLELDAIRRIVDAKLDAEPWPGMAPGERVRITSGALQGIEGTVLATKQGRRLIVSVTLLQRSVAVELDAAWVATSHTYDMSVQ